ncbi:MAG: hypothetical protein ISS25_03585 [Nanoarchaeota archaeon]|nr:hypothetical protein [DPANN group archaeon]MBL7116884.1 hypothetical protein [Nanoarchaeota archaeon]
MAKHVHDIHYMLIVLILAFFVITLSYNQVNPGITGQVVKRTIGTEGFVVKFLRSTTAPSDFKAVSTEGLLTPIKINTVRLPWKKILNVEIPVKNIGGETVYQMPAGEDVVKTNLDCAWVNLNNKDFIKLRSLSGHMACRATDYDSCLMTNTVKTMIYYSSGDGSFKDVMFKDVSNNFNNCYNTIRTTDENYRDESGDVRETKYTTVFCCK